MMNNVFPLLLAACFSLFSCVGQSAEPAKKFTKLEGSQITGLEIGSGFQVVIEQGPVAKAEFEVSADWIDKLHIELDQDGTLDVSMKAKNMTFASKNPVLKLRLVCSTLNKIEASGAASIEVKGAFSGSKFKVDASGASVVEFTRPITVSGLVEIDASGASVVKAIGTAGRVEIEASGASKINLSGLTTAHATCDASGASAVELYASDEARGEASGASNVRVWGGGMVNFQSVSGAASVQSK